MSLFAPPMTKKRHRHHASSTRCLSLASFGTSPNPSTSDLRVTHWHTAPADDSLLTELPCHARIFPGLDGTPSHTEEGTMLPQHCKLVLVVLLVFLGSRGLGGTEKQQAADKRAKEIQSLRQLFGDQRRLPNSPYLTYAARPMRFWMRATLPKLVGSSTRWRPTPNAPLPLPSGPGSSRRSVCMTGFVSPQRQPAIRSSSTNIRRASAGPTSFSVCLTSAITGWTTRARR